MSARRLRWIVEYSVGRAALFAVNLLPQRPAYAVLAGLGRLYFRCSKRRQGYALRLLRNAYPGRPDAELRDLARNATGSVFKVVLDMVRVGPAIRSGRLRDAIDMSEVPADTPDPPFIGVTAHLGSWEIGAIAFAMFRGESHVIARAFRNPLLQRFLVDSRRQARLHVHPKRGGIRGLARALQRGCIGLQAVDQHQRLRGVMVPFFGELASTERAAATLSLRSHYPIVVGAAVRVGPGFRFKVVLLPALRPVPSGDHEADVARVAAEVNRRLEQLILAYPEQYLWIHNRYREVQSPATGSDRGGGDPALGPPGDAGGAATRAGKGS